MIKDTERKKIEEKKKKKKKISRVYSIFLRRFEIVPFTKITTKSLVVPYLKAKFDVYIEIESVGFNFYKMGKKILKLFYLELIGLMCLAHMK